MKRLLSAALLAIVLPCTTPAHADAVSSGESTIRKGNGPEPETLDPHKARSVSAQNVLRDLYEGLVGEAPDGTLVPGAAERWDVADDARTYTFRLRGGARWSNGDAVTADDFVFAFRRSADPATGSRYPQILAPIANAAAVTAGKLPPAELGVDAVDALTVRIRLAAPTPYFLQLLTHPATYPVHRPSLSAYGSQFARPGRLIGNGAYVLTEWIPHSHLVLRRNVRYWNDAKTAIDRVVVVATEDVSSELKRFLAGELDWTEQIPASQGAWIREHLPDAYRVHPYLGVAYYGFNLTRPPFADAPKLRRALALAVDRDVIARKVLGSGEIAAGGWVPPGIPGHAPVPAPWNGRTRAQCLEEARRLYAEAGYSDAHPLEVEIRYNTNDDHRKIATVVAAMWKQWLGVRTTLINEESKVYLQERRLKARTQVFRAAWVGDYDDPYTFLEVLGSTSGMNDTGWSDPRYDALLARAAAEADPAEREARMRDAEARILDELPVLPLFFYVTKRLVSPRLVGWEGNMMDHHYSKDLRLQR